MVVELKVGRLFLDFYGVFYFIYINIFVWKWCLRFIIMSGYCSRTSAIVEASTRYCELSVTIFK